MTRYRCYFMGQLNHINDASVIAAPSDADAIGFAIAQLDATPAVAVEIWDGARRVAHAARLDLR